MNPNFDRERKEAAAEALAQAKRHSRNPVLDRLVEGLDYGKGDVTISQYVDPQYRAVAVLYHDLWHSVWVMDPGVRPPAPSGVWMDDLVSEACRRLFGEPKGSCRPIAGCARDDQKLEFRPYWIEPLIGKVTAKVDLSLEGYDGKEFSRRRVKVFTKTVPGADEESVILSEVYSLAKHKYGTGRIRWVGQSALAYRRVPAVEFGMRGAFKSAGDPNFVCRYTVIRSGTPHEIMIDVPSEDGANWDAVRARVATAAGAKFGPGTLKYAPELGETYFEWV